MAEENLKEELKKTVEEAIEKKIKPILEEAKQKHKETKTETEKLKVKEIETGIKSGLKNLWEKFKFWALIGTGILLIFLEKVCRKIHLPRIKTTGAISLPGVKGVLFTELWFLFGCGIYLMGVIWFFISGFGTKEKKSFSGFLSDILKIVIWSGITIGLGGVFLRWAEGVLPPVSLNWLIYPIGICWLILGFRATIEILEGDEVLKISLMMLAVICGLFLIFLSFSFTQMQSWNWQVLFTKQNLGFWMSLTFLFLTWYILKGTYQWTLKTLLILFPILLILILNTGYKTIKPKPVPRAKHIRIVKPKIREVVVPKLELGMRPVRVKVVPREKIRLIFRPNPQWIWDGKSGYEVFLWNGAYRTKIYEIKKIENKKTWNFKNPYSHAVILSIYSRNFILD